MTRTTRRDYRGRPIRDGQHGRRCPQCFIRLPLSGEANCDCEPRAAGGPVAQQAPVGTHHDKIERPSRDAVRYN